ncbi:glycine-rich protein [Crocinitomix sp.]|nr:glycine-rich protein [Crocinitomix sp.]
MKLISFLFTGVLLCINTLSFGQDEIIFEYTGDVQTYVVPGGVTDIQIECWGAQGQALTIEDYIGSVGGLGGYTVGSTSVTPGEVLSIYVGGMGAEGAGGYNGGGTGGYGSPSDGGAGYAGSGGGASDVRFGGVAIEDRIIVAGGGGGGGRDYVNGSCVPCGTGGNGGVGGGLTGGDGDDPGDDIYMTYYNPGSGGNGGTPVDGGAGGLGSEGDPGNPGVLNVGGDGLDGSYSVASGGGGGGYYGGGSGGGVSSGSGRAGGGGAGGSSYIGDLDDAETISGIRSGNGRIIITILCVGLSLEPVETEICLGDEIILDGSSETGGIVMWDGGVVNGEAFDPGPAGEYTYTAISTSGTDCNLVVDINVRVLPIIVANADPEVVCFGQELTLSGSGGAYYDWSPGDIENGVPFVPDFGIMTYTVEGEDWYGCFNTAEVTVEVIDAPVVTANATDDKLCLGESIILTGSGALTYEWDMGVEDGVSFTPETIGTFVYNVDGFVDGEGCFGEASIEITVNELPTIESYTTIEELLGDDGSINITVSGGTPAYDFDWDNDGAGEFGDPEDLTGIAGGTYTVVVSDANGCEDTETIVVDSKLTIGQNAESVISVYPNPTNDRLVINSSGNFSIQLFSVNGDILLTKSGVNQMEISLSEFSTGIYLLEIEENGEVQTVKVIKE